MKEFDCVVIGQDLYSLIIALFLSRKMRKVLLIQDRNVVQAEYEKINLKTEDKSYHISYNRNNIVAGLDSSGLLYAYLDNLGLESTLKYEKMHYEMVVDKTGRIRKRMNSLEQFRVYLVRYYPKHRNEIHDFFTDLEKHYKNYIVQYSNMLKNTDYTLTSLMIEWGDYSLKELLNKYFSSEELVLEFATNNFINGLEMDKVDAYAFFINFFSGLKNGFYIMENSEKDICDKIIEKIKLLNPNAILKTKIKKFILKDNSEIDYLIDQEGNEILAKYFFISDNPVNVYKKYFKEIPGIDDDIEIIKEYYPYLDSSGRINTLYCVIEGAPIDFGLNELNYYFKNDLSDQIKLIRLYNYTYASKRNIKSNEVLLCLDFTYDDSDNITAELVLEKLKEFMPKIAKAVVTKDLGKPKQYFPMLRTEKFRKNLTINEMIDIEALENTQVLDNFFVGGSFIRPEAGFFGVIKQGVVFGDKIEDHLYYGDNEDETFEYFSNDEIMMMIRHNYDYTQFGKTEVHVNFHIGKSSYFIRCKGKNIVIHHGKYGNADLSIYTTNDKLSNLLLKKNAFNEVLDSGFLKYRGDADQLFKVVRAFQLDDYQEYSPEEYRVSKYKFLGVKFLFVHIFIYATATFLSNYFNNIYLFPAAFGLAFLVSFIKFKIYKKINWFEIVVDSSLFIYAILSIFWQDFNIMKDDNIFLALMTITFLVSVFVNQPIVYLYHQYDMNIDYRNTKLFKIITNGLTFIWGFIFLAILGGTYITGERYFSALYAMLFLGVFMTYYYPVIYVKTSIKKK